MYPCLKNSNLREFLPVLILFFFFIILTDVMDDVLVDGKVNKKKEIDEKF